METNQIYNSGLKENIVNAAIGVLVNNNLITQEDFKGLGVHFGYMFSKDNDQIEALFKLNFPDKAFFFAVQEGKLMMVNINDQMYEQTIDYMKANHPCILNDELPETENQKQRRIKNNEYVKSLEISTADKLISRWDDDQITVRDKESVCKRAMACFFMIQVACDIGNGAYDESIEYFKPIVEKFGLTDQLNSKEQRLWDGTYEMQDAIDMDWAYEAYWSLCWCLGLVDDIKDAEEVCDCEAAINFIKSCESVQEFTDKCTLRSKAEILDMLDLYYRYSWAINDSKVNPNTSIGDLNPSVVIERRRGLEWIISDIDDWYDIDMPA